MLTLYINNTIPFLQTPAFHIAHWEAGFAQSISRHLFYPYGTNFGYPTPMPIAFGLSCVWPAAFLIRTGVEAIHAYTIVNAFWIIIAFFGAFFCGKFFKNNFYVSCLGSFLWFIPPAIVWHSWRYGSLALGFALLPLCFYSIFILLFSDNKSTILKFFLFPLCAVSIVFMDGYNFIFFIAGTGILFLASLFKKQNLKIIIFNALFIGFTFLLSGFLYRFYTKGMPITIHSLDAFATFGLDLKFWFLPSIGLSALIDWIGLTSYIEPGRYWGDTSKTFVYASPIIILGIWGFLRAKKTPLIIAVALISLLSFWLALGPVIIFDGRMPAEYTGSNVLSHWGNSDFIKTGNAFIAKLPVLGVMRGAYRWVVLTNFCLWLLALKGFATIKQRYATGLIFIACVFFIPSDIPGKLGQSGLAIHKKYNSEFIPLLEQTLKPDEIVAFIPWGNDFSINYSSSLLNFKSPNTGGDKNFQYAQSHWPPAMKELGLDQFSTNAVLGTLDQGANAVIVRRYPSILWHYPIDPDTFHKDYAKWIDELRPLEKAGEITLTETPYFTVVRKASKTGTPSSTRP